MALRRLRRPAESQAEQASVARHPALRRACDRSVNADAGGPAEHGPDGADQLHTAPAESETDEVDAPSNADVAPSVGGDGPYGQNGGPASAGVRAADQRGRGRSDRGAEGPVRIQPSCRTRSPGASPSPIKRAESAKRPRP